MKKIINCQVIPVLYEIMRHHTEHYHSDFDCDRNIITTAARTNDQHEKTLLWMSRPCGTHCFSQRQAYISDTHAHNSWRFYGEQTDDAIEAYAVEIKGIEDGYVVGDIYELNYAKHFKHIAAKSLEPDSIIITRKNGGKQTVPYDQNWHSNIVNLADVDRIRFHPQDIGEWDRLINEEQTNRLTSKYTECDLKKLKSFYGSPPLGKCDEADFVNSEARTFGIYQLKNEDRLHFHYFASLDILQKGGYEISRDNYNFIYAAPLPDTGSLESIYTRFNINHPADFTGHSLSVSDVVVTNIEDTLTAYYVDSFGFKEIPEFFGTASGSGTHKRNRGCEM